MSIASPHPVLTTAGSSPSKIAMATVQVVMMSGRYRTESLCSHWSKNKSGVCLLYSNMVEDLNHILRTCNTLTMHRDKLYQYTMDFSFKLPSDLSFLLLQLCSPSHPLFCNFLLDCSTIPSVISAVQQLGPQVLNNFFTVTHTWVYVLP